MIFKCYNTHWFSPPNFDNNSIQLILGTENNAYAKHLDANKTCCGLC